MSFDQKKYLKKDKKNNNKKTAACIKAKLGFFNEYFWSEIAYTFRFDGSMDTFYRLTNLCKYHFFFPQDMQIQLLFNKKKNSHMYFYDYKMHVEIFFIMFVSH